jgi:hypothetical protein
VISLVAKVKTTASVRLAVVSLCLVQFVDVLGVTVVGPTRGAVGILLLVLALVLAGLFAALDRRSCAPLLPGFLLRQRLLRQGALGRLLNTLTTSSALTLVTLYLQDTRGLRPMGPPRHFRRPQPVIPPGPARPRQLPRNG